MFAPPASSDHCSGLSFETPRERDSEQSARSAATGLLLAAQDAAAPPSTRFLGIFMVMGLLPRTRVQGGAPYFRQRIRHVSVPRSIRYVATEGLINNLLAVLFIFGRDSTTYNRICNLFSSRETRHTPVYPRYLLMTTEPRSLGRHQALLPEQNGQRFESLFKAARLVPDVLGKLPQVFLVQT